MQGIVTSFVKSMVIGQLYAGIALVELAAGLIRNLLDLELDSTIGLGLSFYVSIVNILLLFASANLAL